MQPPDELKDEELIDCSIAGKAARVAEMARNMCPFDEGTARCRFWLQGWDWQDYLIRSKKNG
jgi:ribosome modulation factor